MWQDIWDWRVSFYQLVQNRQKARGRRCSWVKMAVCWHSCYLRGTQHVVVVQDDVMVTCLILLIHVRPPTSWLSSQGRPWQFPRTHPLDTWCAANCVKHVHVMRNLLREARIISLASWICSINFSKHKTCGSTFLSDTPSFPKEHCVWEDTQTSPLRNIKMKMSTEHWWNATDRGKLKSWDRILCQCHFVYHKYHVACEWTHSSTGRGWKPTAWSVVWLSVIITVKLYLKIYFLPHSKHTAHPL